MSTMTSVPASPPRPFFGVWAVRAAFLVATFGWGVGFYGPPIFLHAVVERTSWPLEFVSLAVTMHFLVGAAVVANLPRIHRRFGLPLTTALGAVVTSLGVEGWAVAHEPWQLLVAVVLSGAGWVTMGAAAINAIVAPWYSRTRPIALAKAYNGASIGGVIFSPLWVALISHFGFATASAIVGSLMTVTMVALACSVLARTPLMLGQTVDGDAPGTPALSLTSPFARPLPGRQLWRDRRFLTLAAGMAVGLFAQIGLIAHLFSLLVPVMGDQRAGLLMGLATGCAIVGRSVVARAMPIGCDRRLVLSAGYAVQLVGTFLLLAAGETQVWMIVAGVVLFGSGIGNATSLPPLVAQVEFTRDDVPRAIALIVAIGQAGYAFAPAAFALLLITSMDAGARFGHGVTAYFAAVAMIQVIAIACFMAGRHRAS
jgi:hypothetical protein